MSVSPIFAWINARAGQSARIAVKTVCDRLRLIRKTACYGILFRTGMKDNAVCTAAGALDPFTMSTMSRPSWALIAGRSSGTTSSRSSFLSCFRPISLSAGVAMSPRRYGANIRNGFCIAGGDNVRVDKSNKALDTKRLTTSQDIMAGGWDSGACASRTRVGCPDKRVSIPPYISLSWYFRGLCTSFQIFPPSRHAQP